MKALVASAPALVPSLALAHSGHGAPVFHTHEWEIGLALIAAIALVGIGLRALGKRQ